MLIQISAQERKEDVLEAIFQIVLGALKETSHRDEPYCVQTLKAGSQSVYYPGIAWLNEGAVLILVHYNGRFFHINEGVDRRRLFAFREAIFIRARKKGIRTALRWYIAWGPVCSEEQGMKAKPVERNRHLFAPGDYDSHPSPFGINYDQ